MKFLVFVIVIVIVDFVIIKDAVLFQVVIDLDNTKVVENAIIFQEVLIKICVNLREEVFGSKVIG